MQSNSDTEQQAYWSSRDHFRHTAGCPPSTEFSYYGAISHHRFEQINNRLRFSGQMDMAWLIMLQEQDLVDDATVKKLGPVLLKSQTERGWGGEAWIKKELPDHDEAAASAVNYGRTLQEPMARMMIREGLLFLIDEILRTLQDILDTAAENLDTMMAGHSHWSHAQPTTYAAYLLAIHDQLSRGLEQLLLAYKHNNRNSGGCGACSGTGWPVDRNRITELLGFEKTIELTYDCEASMDQYLTVLFAAGNMATTLTRTSMDLNVWITEEWNLFDVAMDWRGVSSFMPQKANSGNQLERTRIAANNTLGKLMHCLFAFKNEPVQDILPVYKSDKYVLKGMAYLEEALGLYRTGIRKIKPNKKRMSELLKQGFSGAPDLAIYLIRQQGFSGRSAHRVCGTMVRIARERHLTPQACTGALLDEAARISNDPEPQITTAEVQESMSLDNFFEKHANLGDPNPTETARLLEVRRHDLAMLEQQHQTRKSSVEHAYDNLIATFKVLTDK